jgi:hypothetical protein
LYDEIGEFLSFDDFLVDCWDQETTLETSEELGELQMEIERVLHSHENNLPFEITLGTSGELVRKTPPEPSVFSMNEFNGIFEYFQTASRQKSLYFFPDQIWTGVYTCTGHVTQASMVIKTVTKIFFHSHIRRCEFQNSHFYSNKWRCINFVDYFGRSIGFLKKLYFFELFDC